MYVVLTPECKSLLKAVPQEQLLKGQVNVSFENLLEESIHAGHCQLELKSFHLPKVSYLEPFVISRIYLLRIILHLDMKETVVQFSGIAVLVIFISVNIQFFIFLSSEFKFKERRDCTIAGKYYYTREIKALRCSEEETNGSIL